MRLAKIVLEHGGGDQLQIVRGLVLVVRVGVGRCPLHRTQLDQLEEVYARHVVQRLVSASIAERHKTPVKLICEIMKCCNISAGSVTN